MCCVCVSVGVGVGPQKEELLFTKSINPLIHVASQDRTPTGLLRFRGDVN